MLPHASLPVPAPAWPPTGRFGGGELGGDVPALAPPPPLPPDPLPSESSGASTAVVRRLALPMRAEAAMPEAPCGGVLSAPELEAAAAAAEEAYALSY